MEHASHMTDQSDGRGRLGGGGADLPETRGLGPQGGGGVAMECAQSSRRGATRTSVGRAMARG